MPRRFAHHCFAHRAGAYIGSEIDRRPVFLEEGEVLPKRPPRIPWIWLLPQRDVGPGRVDFTGDLARDSLRDLRYRVRTAQKLELGVTEHVDESGGNDLAAGIDHSFCGQSRNGRA